MATKTIWHIVDWERSFEPDDAVRRGQKAPLRYVKLHIKGRGGLSQQQLDLQRRLLLADPGGVEAWSVYTLACIVSGNRGEGRGYLWNDQDEPANAQEIAVMIGLDVDVVRKALPLLKRRCLLEKVPVPAKRPWTAEVQTPTEPPQGGSTGLKPVPTAGPQPGECGPAPGAGGPGRTPAGPGGNNCNKNRNTELERELEREEEDQHQSVAAGGKAALSNIEKKPAPVGPEGQPAQDTPARPPEGSTGLKPVPTGDGKGPARAQEGQTARPPAQRTTGLKPVPTKGLQGQPGGPKEPPTAGKVEGEGLKKTSSPPPPDSRAAGRGIPAANLATDDAANLFAQAVCLKLGVPRAEYHREHASIVTAWRAAICSGLDKTALQEFWAKGVKIAGEIAKRKKKPNKPGAVWWKRMDAHMAKQGLDAAWADAKAMVMGANAEKRVQRAAEIGGQTKGQSDER